jgi:hypothetical protein
VHASPAPFRRSSTLSKPDTTALSAHRRAADQNAVLCAAQQKRFGEPPRRAEHGRLHHKHTDKAIIKNGPASRLHRLWPMVRLSYPIGALGLGNHAVSGSPASDCCGHVRAVGFFKHLHDAIRIMFPRETPQIRSRLVNRLKRARQPRRSMAARRSAKDAEGTFVRTRGNDGHAPKPAVGCIGRQSGVLNREYGTGASSR